MNTRKASAEISYNGQNITVPMGQYHKELTYTDSSAGEGDTIDIKVQDSAGDWLKALPTKGAEITAKLAVSDWDKEGDDRALDCGAFVLDDFSFSGPPTEGTISAISIPALSAFKETSRSKTWEKVTLYEIAKDIAARASVGLVFDNAPTWTIVSIEQSNQTDCEFLNTLCEKYGFALKVYNSKLVVYDRGAYEKKEPVGTIDKADMTSWSWKTTLAGTYTGGTITYTDPKTEADVTYTVGSGDRMLACSEKADSAADAQRILEAAIAKENFSATTLEIEIAGDPKYCSGQNWTISGLGQINGKYFVDKCTHAIGSGYKTTLELVRVELTEAESVKAAIQCLADIGVIGTPAYWIAHYSDVKYLGTLLQKLSEAIRHNAGGKAITTVTAAIDALAAAKIISGTEYWTKHHADIAYINSLLINAANALE